MTPGRHVRDGILTDRTEAGAERERREVEMIREE